MVHPLVVRLGRTRAFTLLAPRLLPRLDLTARRLSRGRWVPSRLFIPTVVLTTVGHRTGRTHDTPVCAHRGPEGDWLIVASNFGRPHHPAWSVNLLHHPHARVTDHHRTTEVTARSLTPEEKDHNHHRIRTALPVYDTYAARAARDLRVFVLTPRDR